jgi:hypothetical protein
MDTQNPVRHLDLYRLPWNFSDNTISWLEPTSACNIYCDGCYRKNEPQSHKPLEVVCRDLEIFKSLRRSDAISIAGGDPLLHPQIIEIVEKTAKMGFKPIINTNGASLTVDLLRRLKEAGAFGFTFHIDSGQQRPGWKGKSESDLNELRLQFAEMVASVGGLCCAFNSTVYSDTLGSVPEVVDWAGKHIDIVHLVVFILYRGISPDLQFDWYVGGTKTNVFAGADKLPYAGLKIKTNTLKSTDVVAEIRKRFPEFSPCAYLSGTESPDSFKWLLSSRFGTNKKIYGYVGSRFMEIVQAWHHFAKGCYLGYPSPKTMRRGKSSLLLSSFDPGLRKIRREYLSSILTSPADFIKPLRIQSIMIIQPIDVLADGSQNMCDGCPDVTVWDGKLVWSCRLEELKAFNTWIRCVPKSRQHSRSVSVTGPT